MIYLSVLDSFAFSAVNNEEGIHEQSDKTEMEKFLVLFQQKK